MNSREPIFNVPGAVLVLIGTMIAVHAGRQYLSAEDGYRFLVAMAFIPARYTGFAHDIPGGGIATVTSFITHMFIHADSVHLAVNSAWLLAFGSVLCRRMGALRFLAFSMCGGIAGAVAFLVLNPGLSVPVIGASGAVSAMMGGVMRFLLSAIDRGEGHLLSQNPAAIPAMSLKACLTDRRIVLSSIVFVAINLLTIAGVGQLGTVGSIAWEAHLGGYFFGLFAFALLDTAMQKTSSYKGEID